MKNYIAVISFAVLLFVALGCGSLSKKESSSTPKTGSNSSSTSGNGTAISVAEETTGVPECDEVMDMIAEEANNPDDGYVVKAIKTTFLNRIKDGIRQAVEENKNNAKNANNTEQLAKTCKDFKEQLVKYKADEAKKKDQQ